VQDWSAETKQTMAVGQGTLDWKKMMRASVPYLRDLKV